MQTDNRFLDDLARVATGALGVAAGMRAEAESLVRQRFERFLADMDLVTRDEFEAVKAMAAAAREEQERLEKRVAALEAAAGKKPAPKRAARRKRSGTGTAKPESGA
ncbi:MAG: accessory factor UbiK family protein [Alphaproteobacteria bacterium]|nr:accessory factor UbiK family protein [Alphaproteobacteria bacterium]